MDDATNSPEDRVLARTLCAVTGVLLPVALGLTWSRPPFSDDARYSGWALLFSSLGFDTAPHACGEQACSGSELFIVGTLPTLVVALLAAALLLQLGSPSRRWASVATALAGVVLLGLLGEVLVLRSSTSDFDTHRHTLGAGLVVTLWLAVVAMGVSQMLRSALDDRRRN